LDRRQHTVQDAAEHYAVFVMQRTAEELGVAGTESSGSLWSSFLDYLDAADVTFEYFETSRYRKYKENVDNQVPRFVQRLVQMFPGDELDFRVDEANQRNLGNKADFFVRIGSKRPEVAVSLKNYIGSGGITRPQVGSGTYLSFANSYVFERDGVGTYVDPRGRTATFKGSSTKARNEVLRYEGREEFIEPLEVLERLNGEMRDELLGPDCEMHDRARVRAVVARIAPEGIRTVLQIFSLLGPEVVQDKFLAAIGMDGKEEALYFDSERYVDSITDKAYHDLRARLNDADTEFTVGQHLQSIRFSFSRGGEGLLAVDVPFTINTNGAWYRPRQRYEGIRTYVDKGVPVELRWGQRRPRKSREIATSTNTYIDLTKIGIFGL